MTGEHITVSEALAAPGSFEAAEARDLLAGLGYGVQQLVEQRKEVDEAGSKLSSFSFPAAEHGGPLSLEEQAAYLTTHFDRIRVDDFVVEGFRVGAARLDARNVQEGREPVHAGVVGALLASDRREETFRAGNEDVYRRGVHHLRVFPAPQYARAAAGALGPEIVNPVVLLAALGHNYRTTKASGKYAILSLTLDNFMKHQNWPPKLVGIAAGIGMHHAAMRSARQQVMPLLGAPDKLPVVKPGMEEVFWASRLYGNQHGDGSFYYLGYLDKSRGLLAHALRREWGEDYVRNRQTLASAMLMRASALPAKGRAEAMAEIRRPILLLIREGYFEAAFERLQDAARETPRLFSRLGRRILLGEDAPLLPDDADEVLSD